MVMIFNSIANHTLQKIYVFFALLLCLALRWIDINNPLPVIDEVYFANYIGSFVSGQWVFDLHPSAGKIIIASVLNAFDYTPHSLDKPWDDAFEGNGYLLMRVTVSLASVALLWIMYRLVWATTKQWQLGMFVLVVFGLDAALIIQGKFIFFDSFLLLFGFAGLLCMHRFLSSWHWPWLIAAGLLAGCAFAVKWTGLSFVGLIGLWGLLACIYGNHGITPPRGWLVAASVGGLVAISAMAGYLVWFVLHYLMVDTPAAMGESFLSWLVEIHRMMWASNQDIQGHVFASHWYQWPLNNTPLGYRGVGEGRIDLIGNSVVWWLGALSVVLLLGRECFNGLKHSSWQAWGVLIGYFSNMLPFALIDRPMFIHHYLVALVFSVLAWVLLIKSLPIKRGLMPIVLWLFGAMVVVGFWWSSPLVYGLVRH